MTIGRFCKVCLGRLERDGVNDVCEREACVEQARDATYTWADSKELLLETIERDMEPDNCVRLSALRDMVRAHPYDDVAFYWRQYDAVKAGAKPERLLEGFKPFPPIPPPRERPSGMRDYARVKVSVNGEPVGEASKRDCWTRSFARAGASAPTGRNTP